MILETGSSSNPNISIPAISEANALDTKNSLGRGKRRIFRVSGEDMSQFCFLVSPLGFSWTLIYGKWEQVYLAKAQWAKKGVCLDTIFSLSFVL